MKNTGTRWLSALLIGASALLVLIALMLSVTNPATLTGTSAATSVPQQATGPLIAAPGTQTNPAPVYRHSVIPGGVRQSSELTSALARDQYARAHFASFNASKAYVVHTKAPRLAHVSYRMGEKIYWTKKKVRLPAGEALLTDGKSFVRARCGNRISDTAQSNVSDKEPAPEVLDMVIPPAAAGPMGTKQSTSTGLRRTGPVNGALNSPENIAQATAAPRSGAPTTGAPNPGVLPPFAGAPMPGTFPPPTVEPKPGTFPPPTVEPKPGVVPPPPEAPKPGTVPPPTGAPGPGPFPPPTEGPIIGPFPPPVTVLPPPLTPPMPPVTVPENPTEIPEPATFALVTLALISLMFMQQRRRPNGKTNVSKPAK